MYRLTKRHKSHDRLLEEHYERPHKSYLERLRKRLALELLKCAIFLDSGVFAELLCLSPKKDGRKSFGDEEGEDEAESGEDEQDPICEHVFSTESEVAD